MSESLNCPWCGTPPVIQPWHGGGPRKRMIGCENDDCPVGPSTTGTTREKAIAAWNTRPEAVQAAERMCGDAWYCTKDGENDLGCVFFATNPKYKAAHPQCNWQEVPLFVIDVRAHDTAAPVLSDVEREALKTAESYIGNYPQLPQEGVAITLCTLVRRFTGEKL